MPRGRRSAPAPRPRPPARRALRLLGDGDLDDGRVLALGPAGTSRAGGPGTSRSPGRDGLNLADIVVTPFCQALNEPLGSIFCTSNTSVPVGAAVAHVMVKFVPAPPEVGLAFIGTFTVPCMSVGWMEQWYGYVPANENVNVKVPLCGIDARGPEPDPREARTVVHAVARAGVRERVHVGPTDAVPQLRLGRVGREGEVGDGDVVRYGRQRGSGHHQREDDRERHPQCSHAFHGIPPS